MSDIIFDLNYEYCWRDVESCASFDVRGYSDKIQIVEEYFERIEVIAEYDIVSVPLDLEDLWVQMADVFDTHIMDCGAVEDFSSIATMIRTIKSAAKHGADENLIRSMMADAITPCGEYWLWSDEDAVMERMLGVMRGEIDPGSYYRNGDFAGLNEYVQPIPLAIPDRMKESVLGRLSDSYDILDNKICVKSATLTT